MYEYHMVQVPPNISVSNKQQGNEAATYLQNVVNTMLRMDGSSSASTKLASRSGRDVSQL